MQLMETVGGYDVFDSPEASAVNALIHDNLFCRNTKDSIGSDYKVSSY